MNWNTLCGFDRSFIWFLILVQIVPIHHLPGLYIRYTSVVTTIDEEVNNDKKEDTDEQYVEKEITRKVEGGNKQARRSERIKKQRVEIHPDDIGDNDDEKDKNYK